MIVDVEEKGHFQLHLKDEIHYSEKSKPMSSVYVATVQKLSELKTSSSGFTMWITVVTFF